MYSKMSTIYKINGESIISPEAANVTKDSLADENSGRTVDGAMHIYWILTDISSVQLKFPPLTTAEVSHLLSMTQGKEYSLTYLDPIKGITTSRFYTSKSSSNLQSGVLYGGLWTGVSFNAIEMMGETE